MLTGQLSEEGAILLFSSNGTELTYLSSVLMNTSLVLRSATAAKSLARLSSLKLIITLERISDFDSSVDGFASTAASVPKSALT